MRNLEWEMLPIDFRTVPNPKVDWTAWAGYEPRSGKITSSG